MVATCYHSLLLTVTCVTQCLNPHIFCPSVNNSTNGQHMKIHWSFIGISYLAQEVTVIFAKSNHMSLISKKTSPQSLLARSGKVKSTTKTQLMFLCIIHTHAPVLVLK